jgi:hypothetical protein
VVGITGTIPFNIIPQKQHATPKKDGKDDDDNEYTFDGPVCPALLAPTCPTIATLH